MDLIKGTDYYIDEDGLYVFTAHYLLKRGECCGNGCKHCPYNDDGTAKKDSGNQSKENQS